MVGLNYYDITLHKGLKGGGVKMFSSLYKCILVNGFGEARSEARIAKVAGVGFLGGISPTS